MNLPDAVRILDDLSNDPTTGLPEEIFLFVSRVTPLVNVDLLIQADHRTLLTWRSDQFYGAGWHIPGGIIRYKETASQRIQEVARDELGATVEHDPAPFAVLECIAPERDRGHFISLLYRCRILSGPDPRVQSLADPPEPGSWRWHKGCPPDFLGAQDMYRKYL